MLKRFVLMVVLVLGAGLVPALAQQEGDDDSPTMESFRDFIGASGVFEPPAQSEPPPDEPEVPAETEEPEVPVGTLPRTLTNFDGGYQGAVGELQAAGVIPDGGSLVFQENRVFANARGTGYYALAENAGFPDVVMAGRISFTSTSAELESCGLVARIGGTANNVSDFLVVGITNQQFGFALESSLPSEEGIAGFGDGLGGNHHILFIAQDDTVTVYLDGELVLADFPVVERTGFYGLRITSDPDTVTDCEASNVWAYRIGSGAEVCEIIANSNVNRRSGPGTNFGVAGQLMAGEVYVATGQATDSSGFTWYELEGGAFVREDVVRAEGACAALPPAS